VVTTTYIIDLDKHTNKKMQRGKKINLLLLLLKKTLVNVYYVYI